MRICHLHIGPHKTATTTLQACLHKNAPRLASAGLYVPKMKDAGSRLLHNRFAVDMGQGTAGRRCERLAAELRKAGLPERVVISSEKFSVWIRAPETRDRLAEFFSGLGYELRVIAYIRPQISAVNSYYSQRIKTLLLDRRFDSFFDSFLEDSQYDHLWRFQPLAEDRRIATTFVPFSSVELSGGICAGFLARLGLDPETFSRYFFPRPKNISPGPKTVEAFMRIGEQLARTGKSIPQRHLVSRGTRLRRLTGAMGWDNDKFNGLGPEQKTRLMSHFRAPNEAFARLAWNSPWGDHFAADEKKALEEARCCFDPAQADAAERAEFDAFCRYGLEVMTHLPAAAGQAPGQQPEPTLPAAAAAALRRRRTQRRQRQKTASRRPA